MVPDYDLIIVGAGAAGLTAALKAYPLKTLMITLEPSNGVGSTTYAQGGIAVAIGPEDSIESHLEDTLKAGGELVDPQGAKTLVKEGIRVVQELMEEGLDFDRDARGNLLFGREGAHSLSRILHMGGDSTGKRLSSFLWNKARSRDHLKVANSWRLVKVERLEGLWVGTYLTRQNQVLTLCSPNIVLATGSPGAIFSQTTNPSTSLGDGLTLALSLGLPLENLEMVQFHPTALKIPGDSGSLPLISEAVRGRGAQLVDQEGKALSISHPMGSLGPRDVVARALWKAHQEGKDIYLDTPQSIGKDFPRLFPNIYQTCKQYKINPVLQPIPVIPAVHYHMGGIKVNLEGRTAHAGLYVLGELASSGVHGANRLASNSLLECLVMGDLAIEHIKNTSHSVGEPVLSSLSLGYEMKTPELKEVFSQAMGPFREKHSLTQAYEGVDQALRNSKKTERPNIFSWCQISLLWLQKAFLLAALSRKESRGAHFRLDYPETLPAFQASSMVKIENQDFICEFKKGREE